MTNEEKLRDSMMSMGDIENRVSDEYWKSTARQCKICFDDDTGEEDESNKWISPCKCDGSIKWVHENCFKRWLKQAPFPQQSACSTCRRVFCNIFIY